MNDKPDYHFGISVDRMFEGAWSFGSCISHSFGQTYLFISFAIWTISIGWLIKYESEATNEQED